MRVIQTSNPRLLLFGFVAPVLLLVAQNAKAGQRVASNPSGKAIEITVLYDNYTLTEGLRTGWGFACMIKGTEKNILFDTGADGSLLLENMDKLQVGAKDVDLVVISHDHEDHTDGLYSFLNRNSKVLVYLPISGSNTWLIAHSAELARGVESRGAKVQIPDGPLQICEGVHVAGLPIMDWVDAAGQPIVGVVEQFLVLDTDKGLVVITGCAHPGIVEIVQKAKQMLNKDVYLVFGGFHLLDQSDSQIQSIIRQFRELGVQKVGASHCTGDRAIQLFKEAYREDFVPIGVGSVNAGDAVLAKIVVDAGKFARLDTPVSASLAGLADATAGANMYLVEVRGAQRDSVPFQIESGTPPQLWWIVTGATEAGIQRTYEFVKGPGSRVQAVGIVDSGEHLEIVRGNKVLRYNYKVVPAPQGQSRLYDRGAFIHPLWSPSGAILTNIHSPDHIHHLGIWMPWTKTKFEDKEVDFWNLGEGQGTVRFVKFLSTASGPVYGGFQSEHDHVVLKTSAGEKVVLKEVWDVRAYNIGGTEKGYWLWDFVSTQRCATDSPLYQMEYRYGGFGFRGAAQWQDDNGTYLTSEGKTRKDGHGTRARWCDMAGAIDGKWAGVTVMSNPQNFRHPEPMRIWDKGQVFFNFAPSQLGDWIMEPGKDYVFRYRLYVHEGKVDVNEAERIWRDYAEPPNVKLEPVSGANKTVLFDGKDFSQWTHEDGKPMRWEIEDGTMKVIPKTGSIITKQNFRDFKLHIEFKIPQMPPDVKGQGRGNSGVYIQRRYEVQILDSYGLEPTKDDCGSLYKQRAPDKNVCKQPGEWQSYDITFRAARFKGEGENLKKVENARITILHNGVLIHNDVELLNKTGAGRPEGPEPGPILLQEHGNEVWFRNIWIVPL